MSAQPARVLAESSRVEAFSDGVLAIAITLLVLDLHASEQSGHVAHAIVSQWPTYVAYITSFLYIGVVWVNHHSLFSRIARVDGGLLWCNLSLLLAASVLPFPTSQLVFAMEGGTRGDRLASLALYAVVSAAMAATWLLVFTYLVRHGELLTADVTPAFFRAERKRAVFGLITPAIPVAVGVGSPIAALVVMAVTPAFYALTADGLNRNAALRRPAPPE